MSNEADVPSSRRLQTWGEIASYLNVAVRTAQLWEKEGLPVHRAGGRVFAYTTELDEWQKSREVTAEKIPLPTDDPGDIRLTRIVKISAAALLIIGLILGYLWLQSNSIGSSVASLLLSDVVEPRLFVRASSEGRSVKRVALPQAPYLMAAADDDTEVYLVPFQGPTLFIVDTSSWQVRSVSLPFSIEEIQPVKDGRLFLMPSSPRLLIYDKKVGKITENIPTTFPVTGVAVDPETNNLYLGMAHRGVRRLAWKTREWKQITRDGCPYFVDINAPTRMLLISYQCGGPTGRQAHDAIELIDLRTEERVAAFSGPPLVGGIHRFSQDGRFVLLDAWDACRTASYDQEGCPFIPADISYVWRVADRQIVKTIAFPAGRGGQPAFFPSGSRILIGGGMHVLDTSLYKRMESFRLDDQNASTLSSDGHRAYVMLSKSSELAVIEAEPAGCSDPGAGRVHMLTGDGTEEDLIDNAAVSPRMRFQPGYIGQAFELDGIQQPVIGSSSASKFGGEGSTISLYLKAKRSPRDQTVLEWGQAPQTDPWQIVLAPDGAVRVTISKQGAVADSLLSPPIPSDVWTHVAVSSGRDALILLVNGRPVATSTKPARLGQSHAYRLGWSATTNAPLVGLIDELTIWSRALTPPEVSSLYERRRTGPCKL